MNQPRYCPQCGAELPRDAMEGLCPRCMARVVFGEAEAATAKPEENLAATIRVEMPVEGMAEGAGTRIGRYKLLEQIGEGGFGVVYMAEQVEPVQRKVALKVIKAGMDTKEVIARFEAERQALALMDHPNIAKILDAGVTDTPHPVSDHPLPVGRGEGLPHLSAGRPYFVMELVKGIPITEFCDLKKLSPTDRLELFMKVCQAVQHAHQKGIIHRDIKPSNVLVTQHDGEPVPKVIDFGIAKALGPKLTNKTLFTGFAHLLGTPAYMSPEQAELSGLDIDTRSDIYSLGVLLYELLTGVTPFEREVLAKAALDEVRRMIRETEPPRPSTRLRTLGEKLTEVAQRRGTEPAALNRLVRGDLDWIVMKCLEKDRKRRYETANGLAMDLRRHLDHEPVTAASPSASYRAQKFIGRNKGALAVGASMVLLLLAGTIVSTWQAVRATRAERQAKAEGSKSTQVAQFLKQMLEGVGPSVAKGRDTTVLKEILDKTADSVGKDLKDQPEVEAELRLIMGRTYRELGLRAEAESMAQEALRLRKLIFGYEHVAVAEALDSLSSILYDKGDLPGAETVAREAVALMKRLWGPEHTNVGSALNNLGNVLQTRHDLAGAKTIHSEALAMRRKLLGKDHRDVAVSLNNLGNVLFQLGDPGGAEAFYREALTIFKTRLGPTNPTMATVSHNVGILLSRRGDLNGAEAMHREVLATKRVLLGNDHPDIAMSLNELAMVLAAQGEIVEAEERVIEAAGKKLLGSDHWRATTTTHTLAIVLSKKGDLTAAEEKFGEALMMRKKLLTDEHPLTIESLNSLAVLVAVRGDLLGAETRLGDALRIRRKVQSNENPELIVTLLPLSWVKRQQGDFSQAESLKSEALSLSRQRGDFSFWVLIGSIYELTDLLQVQGKFAEAQPLLMEGFEYTESNQGAKSGFGSGVLEHLVSLYEAWGKPDAAAQWRKKLEEFNNARSQAKPALPAQR